MDDDDAAPMDTTATTTTGQQQNQQPKRKIEVKKWNAVAVWSWSTSFDSCAICRNTLHEPSIEFQASNVRGQGEEEGLSIAVRFFFSLMIIFFKKASSSSRSFLFLRRRRLPTFFKAVFHVRDDSKRDLIGDDGSFKRDDSIAYRTTLTTTLTFFCFSLSFSENNTNNTNNSGGTAATCSI